VSLQAEAPQQVGRAEPHQADGGRQQADGWIEVHAGIALLQKIRRRKVVHEGKRQDEGHHDLDAPPVDADRVPREVLFQRHRHPAQRVDPDHPERHGRDRERDPEVDQRAAEDHERDEDHEDPVDVDAGNDRGEPERHQREQQAVRHDLLRHGQHLKERIQRPDEKAVELPGSHVLGHEVDLEEGEIVQLVPAHPQCVEEEHLPEIPAVHRRERAHRHVQRAQCDRVVHQRKTKPHQEVRPVLEQRQDVDSPILPVCRDHR
jgi:hypothetical protein